MSRRITATMKYAKDYNYDELIQLPRAEGETDMEFHKCVEFLEANAFTSDTMAGLYMQETNRLCSNVSVNRKNNQQRFSDILRWLGHDL